MDGSKNMNIESEGTDKN